MLVLGAWARHELETLNVKRDLTNLTGESTINLSNLPVGLTKGTDMALQTPMRVILSIGIILLLTGLLSACQTATAPAPTATPTPSPWIDVILNDPDCAPPCWNGITPGVTTMDETMRILQNEPKVYFLSSGNPADGRPIDWRFHNPLGGGGMVSCSNVDYNLVDRISLSIQSPAITLGQAIEHLGEPNFIYFCPGVEFNYEIMAYYSDKGIILELLNEVNYFRQIKITSNDLVGKIYFVVPFKLAEDNLCPLDWEGYGTYKFEKGWIGE